MSTIDGKECCDHCEHMTLEIERLIRERDGNRDAALLANERLSKCIQENLEMMERFRVENARLRGLVGSDEARIDDFERNWLSPEQAEVLRARIRELENEVGGLEEARRAEGKALEDITVHAQRLEAEHAERVRVGAAVVADAIDLRARIRELEKQRDQLQEANTAEVERRRKAEKDREELWGAASLALSVRCVCEGNPLVLCWLCSVIKKALRASEENHLTAAPEKGQD